MKTLTIVLLILVAGILACESIEAPAPEADIGQVHTEFLEAVFASEKLITRQGAISSAPIDKEELAYKSANEILANYGQEPMSREEVRDALEQGRLMAQEDPVELVKSFLPADQYKWWNTFAGTATAEDAQIVYEQMCARYGPPVVGTPLHYLVDTALSSAEFWTDYYQQEPPPVKKDFEGPQLGWGTRLLRFAVMVTTDGVGGGIAAAGTGGNPVAAGVVGGLCSYAADDILFGDG